MKDTIYNEVYRYTCSLTRNTGNPRDILHTAWLKYWDKNGTDLLAQPIGYICRVVKNTFLTSFKGDHRYWYYNKERFNTCFYEFEDQRFTSLNPETILIEKETRENFDCWVTTLGRWAVYGRKNVVNRIVDLRRDGFTQKEIAETLGVHKSLITYYLKQIKNLN